MSKARVHPAQMRKAVTSVPYLNEGDKVKIYLRREDFPNMPDDGFECLFKGTEQVADFTPTFFVFTKLDGTSARLINGSAITLIKVIDGVKERAEREMIEEKESQNNEKTEQFGKDEPKSFANKDEIPY